MGGGSSTRKNAQSKSNDDGRSALDRNSSPKISPIANDISQFKQDHSNERHNEHYRCTNTNGNQNTVTAQPKQHFSSEELSYSRRNTVDPVSQRLSARSDLSNGNAELFNHTAMSLDMDNDDLLFNLLYFGGGDNLSFGNVLNNVQHETVALYSENNTPYKLHPASEHAISNLSIEIFSSALMNGETECSVCKCDIEINEEIIRIPNCKHYFHKDCLLKWITLVMIM